MKISITFIVGMWLGTTVGTALATETNLIHLIKSIPNSAICPEIICPEDSFVRRDDAGNCGCSTTGPASNCDFIKCATGPAIQNPVTGHCLCPFPHPIVILPQPTCVHIGCPLGGTALYNSTLNSCACPKPPCLATCDDGYRAGFDPITSACKCIKEPVCPPETILCQPELSYRFDEVTLTCGCFPKALETPLNSAPHQAFFKPYDILCKSGTRLDAATCTCVPMKPCVIFCKSGTRLDTATCTCVPVKPCDILCKSGTQLDTATCTCVPIKPCDIFCKSGTHLDTATCTCVPTRPCDILCKTGSTLDIATCTCLPNPTTAPPPPAPGTSSNPSSLPTVSGHCATLAPCPQGEVAGFAPFTLQCGCMNCDALHCPDDQQAKFDQASQKCYCDGVPGNCFDLVCPPPGQQLVFQQMQNPDGTVTEQCACNSRF